MKAITSALVAAAALLLGAPVFAQQIITPGSPSADANVQYRYSNPGQSQQLLQTPTTTATPAAGAGQGAGMGEGSANPFQHALDRRNAGAEGAEGEAEGPTFTNHEVGFGQQTEGPLWVQAEDIYRGIIPGVHDSLPHIARYQARAQAGSATNMLTWIGFQPFEGSTRVFIQTGTSARYAVNASPDGMTLTVRLQNTHISLYNFRRELDSSWFGRAVSSIQAYRNGDFVDVVIALSEASDYTSSQSGDYIFIDFN